MNLINNVQLDSEGVNSWWSISLDGQHVVKESQCIIECEGVNTCLLLHANWCGKF